MSVQQVITKALDMVGQSPMVALYALEAYTTLVVYTCAQVAKEDNTNAVYHFEAYKLTKAERVHVCFIIFNYVHSIHAYLSFLSLVELSLKYRETGCANAPNRVCKSRGEHGAKRRDFSNLGSFHYRSRHKKKSWAGFASFMAAATGQTGRNVRFFRFPTHVVQRGRWERLCG